MRVSNGEKYSKLEAVVKSLGLTAKVNGKTFDKPYDVAVILYHRKLRVITPPTATASGEPAKDQAVLIAAGITAA